MSLTATDLTTGEIAAHFVDCTDAAISKDTSSRVIDKVVKDMAGWWDLPLALGVYSVIVIDAIVATRRCVTEWK